MEEFYRFLTGYFCFCIISSEKPHEAHRRPTGCLSLWNVQKKKCVDYSNIPVLVSFVVDTLIGFHNESDDEAVANRLVRRHNSL